MGTDRSKKSLVKLKFKSATGSHLQQAQPPARPPPPNSSGEPGFSMQARGVAIIAPRERQELTFFMPKAALKFWTKKRREVLASLNNQA